MGTALRPSQPPPAPRAKSLPLSLRAGGVPRTLGLRSPLRADARRRGAEDLAEACASAGISLRELARILGLTSNRGASQAESGHLVMTFGELIELVPLPILLRIVAVGISRRIARERLAGLSPDDARLVAFHVDALRSVLS